MPHSVRVVIQVIHEPPDRSVYRLVVYGDSQGYQPARFLDFEDVLKVLGSALPGFDPATITVDFGERRTRIIFSGDFELDDEQLRCLGVA
jgi:hypothetical protein